MAAEEWKLVEIEVNGELRGGNEKEVEVGK
jgi:hypothetical protein